MRRKKMNEKRKVKIILLLVPVFLFACGRERLSTGEIVSWQEFDFEFNPETVFDDLENGEDDVFMPAAEEVPERKPRNIHWYQEDYLNLVNVLADMYLPDIFWDTHPVSMNTSFLCDEIDQFDYDMHFDYYRYFGEDGNDMEHYLFHISPEKGSIWIYNESRTGNTLKPIQFDFKKTRVTFEDALEIAEENGGQEFREERENECGLAIDLDPDNETELYWEVEYHGPKAFSIGDYYRVYVDAVTGEVIERE